MLVGIAVSSPRLSRKTYLPGSVLGKLQSGTMWMAVVLTARIGMLMLSASGCTATAGSRRVAGLNCRPAWLAPSRCPGVLAAGAAECKGRQRPTLSEAPAPAVLANELCLRHPATRWRQVGVRAAGRPDPSAARA